MTDEQDIEALHAQWLKNTRVRKGSKLICVAEHNDWFIGKEYVGLVYKVENIRDDWYGDVAVYVKCLSDDALNARMPFWCLIRH